MVTTFILNTKAHSDTRHKQYQLLQHTKSNFDQLTSGHWSAPLFYQGDFTRGAVLGCLGDHLKVCVFRIQEEVIFWNWIQTWIYWC